MTWTRVCSHYKTLLLPSGLFFFFSSFPILANFIQPGSPKILSGLLEIVCLIDQMGSTSPSPMLPVGHQKVFSKVGLSGALVSSENKLPAGLLVSDNKNKVPRKIWTCLRQCFTAFSIASVLSYLHLLAHFLSSYLYPSPFPSPYLVVLNDVVWLWL